MGFRRIIWLLGFSLFLAACGQSSPAPAARTTNRIADKDSADRIYEETISRFLVGKRIESLGTVLGRSVPDNTLLLIYNEYDCGTCLDAAFEIIARLRDGHSMNLFVVAVNSGIANVQEHYKYYDYIHQDTGDLLRKELKYVNTPVFLILNRGVIVEIHKPLNSHSNRSEEFISKVTVS